MTCASRLAFLHEWRARQVHDKPLNGKLTCGENIADLGGLKLSYRALSTLLSQNEVQPLINGFSPEQRFFLAWAQVWRENTSKSMPSRCSPSTRTAPTSTVAMGHSLTCPSSTGF